MQRFLVVIAMVLASLASAAELSVKGEADLKVKIDGSRGVVKGSSLDGAVLEKTTELVTLKSAKGETLAKFERNKSSGALQVGDKSFDVKRASETLRVSTGG